MWSGIDDLTWSEEEIKAWYKAYSKVYYQNHKERLKAYMKTYYQAHKKRIKAYQKAYSQTNKGKAVLKAQKIKRRKIINNTAIELISLKEIFIRDVGICQLCSYPVLWYLKYPHPLSPSLDHIIPLSKGGTHIKDNVQLSHLVCNKQKQDDLDIVLHYSNKEYIKWLEEVKRGLPLVYSLDNLYGNISARIWSRYLEEV
jgi:hypothetical protein